MVRGGTRRRLGPASLTQHRKTWMPGTSAWPVRDGYDVAELVTAPVLGQIAARNESP
jgi:hypothetical protein